VQHCAGVCRHSHDGERAAHRRGGNAATHHPQDVTVADGVYLGSPPPRPTTTALPPNYHAVPFLCAPHQPPPDASVGQYGLDVALPCVLLHLSLHKRHTPSHHTFCHKPGCVRHMPAANHYVCHSPDSILGQTAVDDMPT